MHHDDENAKASASGHVHNAGTGGTGVEGAAQTANSVSPPVAVIGFGLVIIGGLAFVRSRRGRHPRGGAGQALLDRGVSDGTENKYDFDI